MIPLCFRLPNAANYDLWISGVKTPKPDLIIPSFCRIIPSNPEKMSNRSPYRPYFRGTHVIV
jgi:hypothetical protein